MKKLITFILLTLISTLLSAQLININPDTTGIPWWVYEVSPVTPEIQAEIDQVPKFVLTPSSAQTTLPLIVDNSQEIYMREVFNQQDGCCGQASGIGYAYTYEINRLRGLAANDTTDNRYPTHFTFNIVRTYPTPGHGILPGSFYHWGWELLKYAGCPNVTDYGGMYPPEPPPWRSRVWESDYNLYKKSLKNRTSDWSLISATTPEGLNDLKHWLNDHNEDSTSVGGLACFSTFVDGETHWEEIDSAIFIATAIDTADGYHAMTIVGYNDTIGWDFNGDDTLTNTIDLNGDSLVTMHDWELGALKIVNSWGKGWPSEFFNTTGYAYIPYKFLADTTYKGYPSKVSSIMVVNAFDNDNDLLLLKVKVAHDARENIAFKTGYAKTANTLQPLMEKETGIFDEQGGPLQMQSRFENDTTPLECAFDFGQFFLNEDFGKIYLILEEFDYYDTCSGKIVSYSIVDYRWGEEFELACESNFPVNILNNNTTYLFVNYDLLVPGDDQVISQNTDLTSDMVSRFSPSVTSNAILSIGQAVKIDMYDSELIIEHGSSMIIGDSVVFHARRGENKISIYGNISIGSNVHFEAEDGATLEINFGINPVNINGCFFTNCTVNSHSDPINISNSTFTNSTFSAVNNTLSWIPYTTNLIHNTFTTDDSGQTAIYLYNYSEFNINEDTIHGYYNGIDLNSSGSGTNINRQLNNNVIDACAMYAVNIYNSAADLAENHIYNNTRGIAVLNRSNVSIYGNPNAQDYSEVNIIENNSSYEIFTTAESFPWYFKYNAIFDPDNSGGQPDALIYYEGDPFHADVRYNCWDNNFNPSIDLYPNGYFVYPTYCPGDGGHKSTEIALDDYLKALEYFENGQYTDARVAFEDMIEHYPETPYAGSALHELFALEKYDGNDYNALKQYYMANDSIQADTILTKLAVFLSNKCEIELQNWQTAIDHFEDVIENPETPEDSIFAIIDLGYTYLLMGDSGYKSTAQGRLLEHKPVSAQAFSEKRNYLISLLPFDKPGKDEESNLGTKKQGELFQNVPNPFTHTTSISFNLDEDQTSAVEIRVYDQVGKEVKRLTVNSVNKGTNSIELNMQGMPAGVYFYSLFVNGNNTDTKKMVVAN